MKKYKRFKKYRSNKWDFRRSDKTFLLEKRYFETYVLAKGTKAREGSDGYIEYTFNTSLKPTPKMNEDGTVDFHTLENVNHIKAVML